MGARVLDEGGKEVPLIMGAMGSASSASWPARSSCTTTPTESAADQHRAVQVALLPLQMQDAGVREQPRSCTAS